MTLRFYLIREISKPFVIILSVLVALFAAFSMTNFLAQAVNGLLPRSAILELTALKAVISLEVLIPASLYVAVLMSFAKLYDESEFAAMSALGVSPGSIMCNVLGLAGGLALIVGVVSLFVRPWAYRCLHELSTNAATFLDVDAMQSGSFYVVQSGTRVIFLNHRDSPGSPAHNVFIKSESGDGTQIISAKLAYTLPEPGALDRNDVSLDDAYIYTIERERGQPDQVVQAQQVTVDPNSHDIQAPADSAVTTGSAKLAWSNASEDVAELQWRLSTPISTLLLAMVAVPLTRTRPRERKLRKFMTAFLIYSGYYLLCTSARTLLQHGFIPATPGIWFVPALLALVLVTLLRDPSRKPGLLGPT